MTEMLYLHNLSHLTFKAAEVECVPMIREIKQKVGYPISEQRITEHLFPLWATEEEKSRIELALLLVEPTIEMVKVLAEEKNPLYEPASLQRAHQILQEMPPALDKNLQYLQELSAWQGTFFKEITIVFNMLPKLRNTQDKLAYNQKLNEFFQKILRNKEFAFNFPEVVHEAHLSHIKGLVESLNKGFIFHFTLEEELKKLDFAFIKGRIPMENLQKIEDLKKKVTVISNGVECAYQLNMRMINLAVILYSYIKWLNSGSL